MSQNAHIEQQVQAYFESLDSEDWERMRGLWHVRGEMSAVGARPRHGREEVMGLLEKLFVPWKVHRDRPVRTIVAGEVAAVEVEFTGTTHDGRDVVFAAVDVIDFEDGLIRKLSNWYDVDYARRTLSGPAGESSS
jgi:ketosteroid isomerase-like protein